MTKPTWIAVMGPRRSRIYQLISGMLSEVADVERPDGPLGIDGCCCDEDSASVQPPKGICQDDLSARFAQLLEAQHRRGAFDRLILVGAEEALARVKGHFADRLANSVAYEIAHNYGVELPAEHVRGLLEQGIEAQ